MRYCNSQQVQRQRIKRINRKLDPISDDLFKIILARKFTPSVRAQVYSQLESLSGYLKIIARGSGYNGKD